MLLEVITGSVVNMAVVNKVVNTSFANGSIAIMTIVNLTIANTLIFLITNRNTNVKRLFIKNLPKLGLIKWILYEIVKHIRLIISKLRRKIRCYINW